MPALSYALLVKAMEVSGIWLQHAYLILLSVGGLAETERLRKCQNEQAIFGLDAIQEVISKLRFMNFSEWAEIIRIYLSTSLHLQKLPTGALSYQTLFAQSDTDIGAKEYKEYN